MSVPFFLESDGEIRKQIERVEPKELKKEDMQTVI